MRMAPFACFFLRFLSVGKPKEVFKTLIFVPTSLPTDVKHHLAGSALQQQNVDIDVLVNTAGVYPTTPSIQVSEQ